MRTIDSSIIAKEIEEILVSLDKDQSNDVMERLLTIGEQFSSEDGDSFIDQKLELLKLSSLAIPHYCSYILALEEEQSQNLLSSSNDNKFTFEKTANQFGKQSYNRVKGIFDEVNFSNCESFVMVGCGALPVTMFQVLEHTNVPKIIGLDVRQEAISTVYAIAEKYQLKRVSALLSGGQNFNFSNCDVVYIANMVSPKKAVLEQIFKTAQPTVQIILRDPYSIGRLWAERGVEHLDNKFEVLSYGTPSPAYFSQDVFLKIT